MSKDITGMDPDKFKNIKKAFETNTIGKTNFDEPSNKISFDVLLNKWKDVQQPPQCQSCQPCQPKQPSKADSKAESKKPEQQMPSKSNEHDKPALLIQANALPVKKKIIKKIVKKKIVRKQPNVELIDI